MSYQLVEELPEMKYLGAGHGKVGVLYMLMKAAEMVDKLREDEKYMKVVEETV